MNTRTQTLTDQLLTLLTTRYFAPPETTAETPFDLMDLDSLVLVEMAVTLTGRYHVKVTDEELREAGTVAATAALLEAKGVQA